MSKLRKFEDEFSVELLTSGLFPEEIISDGQRHRCVAEGDGQDEKNGWYILMNGRGMFGNLKVGSVKNWESLSCRKEISTEINHARAPLTAAPLSQGGVVSLQRCSEIMPQPISWLWDEWLPAGKLTILAGSAGVSKSTVSLSFAATVSRGGSWPDGTNFPSQENVLIWSSEDSANDIIVPRLTVAGADLERCLILREVNQHGKRRAFDPSQDIVKLESAIKNLGSVRLLIIDPIVSVVSGDMHRANEVRRSLQSIIDFAEKYNCAVVGISHVAKGSAGKSPYDRVIGSQAFTALARVVLMAAKEDDGDRRILARAKSNIGQDSGGIEYSLHEASYSSLERKEINASFITWGKSLSGSARELLDQVEHIDNFNEKRTRIELKRLITSAIKNAGGEILSEVLKKEVEAAGFSFHAAKRVKKELNITSEKSTMNGPWTWRLLTDDPYGT
ncbi:AAA family ATPase [Massilia timonae]|uniref:AAA family ATPase n=1 Tax=Massilia timonae TaxID=47229 RepID=UPI0028A0901C|nr:AAA family ATPase [Massilia timonae]